MRIQATGAVPDLLASRQTPPRRRATDLQAEAADTTQISQAAQDRAKAEGGFAIKDILTDLDQALVDFAAGDLDQVDPNGRHDINPLAVRIALDRATGEVSGEVDANYIKNIIKEQGQTGQASVASQVLAKALNYLTQQTPDA
jgi:hypothetical protein